MADLMDLPLPDLDSCDYCCLGTNATAHLMKKQIHQEKHSKYTKYIIERKNYSYDAIETIAIRFEAKYYGF